MSGDPRAGRYQYIGAADLDTVLRFHAQHIGGRPKLVSILGDRQRMDLEALAQYGTVIEVGLEDIFGF